jgi:hypothetical protein
MSDLVEFLKNEGFIVMEEEEWIPDEEVEMNGFRVGSSCPNEGYLDLMVWIESEKKWYATDKDGDEGWDYTWDCVMKEFTALFKRYDSFREIKKEENM